MVKTVYVCKNGYLKNKQNDCSQLNLIYCVYPTDVFDLTKKKPKN